VLSGLHGLMTRMGRTLTGHETCCFNSGHISVRPKTRHMFSDSRVTLRCLALSRGWFGLEIDRSEMQRIHSGSGVDRFSFRVTLKRLPFGWSNIDYHVATRGTPMGGWARRAREVVQQHLLPVDLFMAMTAGGVIR
jgi:hypothetical protein